MWTRDGVRLDADVYQPDSAGDGGQSFPVLLMRQPYGRAIASTIVYAHPRWYAAHGYIVVIQDVRGRGTSQGRFELFANEVADGEEAVNWAAQLRGSSGAVGMYGFSYQGMTQLQAAEAKPPALKTIVPAMTGYHLYEDWATENGALCFQLGLMWSLQLAAETARLAQDSAAFQALSAAARQLPLNDPIPACPKALSAVESFLHDWVSRPATDDYWRQLTPQMAGVDLPMLHVGGWFDPYLRGDLRLYQEMAARSAHLHHFWVGPWAHIPWARRVGDVDFGPAAMSPIDRLQIRWFDAILKGEGDGKALLKEDRTLATQKPLHLFEMGRNEWRQLAEWPTETVKTYYLRSEGLTNIREDSGVLSTEPSETSATDVIVHDPWNPAPALGGHSAIPAGSFERTTVDSRGDVLTYTSALLTDELRVVGVVEFACAIAASTPSYDLCAVLSRVKDGKAFNITQGYRKVANCEPDVPSDVSLPLHPTCFSLAPGECLRLSLSAACFPAYPVNAGTGTPLSESRAIDAKIITLTIHTGTIHTDGVVKTLLKLPVATD